MTYVIYPDSVKRIKLVVSLVPEHLRTCKTFYEQRSNGMNFIGSTCTYMGFEWRIDCRVIGLRAPRIFTTKNKVGRSYIGCQRNLASL